MHHLHYFISTEFPSGVSFYNSNFSRLKNTLRLRGFTYETSGATVAEIVRRAEERGYCTEIIHDSRENSVCGVIVPEMSLGVYFESEIYEKYDNVKREASALFEEAKKIHDKQEEIYIKNTDFDRLNELGAVATQMFFSVKKETKAEIVGKDIHRFFGAMTTGGNVNYIKELSLKTKNRYYIKGRPGTGKSTFLKKLATAGINAGYDVEMYHCALDPKSIDMIIVRELGLCVFDSTAPHEYFPERSGDGIIDIYETCVVAGTDEKYATELEILKEKYETCLVKGKENMKRYLNLIKEEERKKASDKEVTDRLIGEIVTSYF